jgi:hypothetical protein
MARSQDEQRREATMTWRDDPDFRVTKVAKVEPTNDGWQITDADGWSFWVPAEHGVEPQVGELARFYGKGIGFAVRGLVLGGREVFYRTAEEDEEQHREQMYPKKAEDALAKWDAGGSVFTIEMGGLGPGYEQCIQITLFEVIRAFKDKPEVIFSSDGKYVNEEMDKALFANPIIKKLGLSGAQAGAAKNLAWCALMNGWRVTIESVEQGRRIQVSKHFPSAE